MNSFIKTTGGVVTLIIAILCVNIISSNLYFRADVTEDKVFTLSDGTKSILSKLPDEFSVKFYFSRSNESIPPMVKTYATRVEEVLREYSLYSDFALEVEVFDPKPDTDEEEWARKYGISGARLPDGGEIFFGAVFLHGNKEMAIPYFDPRREEFLEYDLTEVLVRMQQTSKPKLGLMTSLPMMGGANPMNPMAQSEGWVAVEGLKKNFEVESIEVSATVIASDINVLMLVHPKDLSEKTLYAIDQFVMRGGKLMVFVDPFSRVDLSMSAGQSQMMGRMPSAKSDLKRLFDTWGIEYSSQNLLGDLSHMVRVNAGGSLVSYPYFFTIGDNGISRKSAVTGKLNQILVAEPGSFKLKEKSELKLEPYVESTEDSGFANAMLATYMGPADFARQLKADKEKHIIAGVISGKFNSAFEGPPAYEKGENGIVNHTAESSENQHIFVMADVDFMHDGNAVDKMQFGPQVITRLKNDNLNLVFNAADHFGGNEDLISIRTSGKISRPFTKVEQLQKNAQNRWKEEEEKLSKQLTELQKKLQHLQGERADANVFTLSADQQVEIEKFRAEERLIRKKRREVRRNLREDIESLGVTLKFVNLFLVPVLILVFGTFVFISRNNRMSGGKS